VVTAMGALRRSTEVYSMVYVAAPFDRTDVATIADEAGEFAAKKRFVALFTESVDADGDTEADWMADLSADFEGFTSDITCVAAGYAPVRSVVMSSLMWRSIGWLAAVRASLVAISRDLGAREDGALLPYGGATPVTKPVRALPTGLFIHDEDLTPGLNADQFMTVMSESGAPGGYYITNPNIMCGPVSDYNLLQLRRTSCEVARLSNVYFTLVLSGDVLLNASGFILDKQADKFEKGNDEYLQSLVTNQNVSSLGTTVGRLADIIRNEPTPVDVRWQPKGYMKTFLVQIAMSRTAV
jgi:hypothetical protein